MGRLAEVHQSFAVSYPRVQYHFVQFFTEHLVDCMKVFGGDFNQVVVLAIVGQRYIQAFFGAEGTLLEKPGRPSISASRIADVCGLPRQTVRRKLALLQERGWVRQTGRKDWELIGAGAISTARDALQGLDQRSADRLARLFTQLETCL